jgi:hypothetical protein
LRRAAIFLEVLAIMSGIGGIIGGLVLATAKSSDSYGNSTHPYVGAAITVIGASIAAAVFYWAIGRALHVYAVDTALRNGQDIVGTSPAPVLPTRPDTATNSTEEEPDKLIDYNEVGAILGMTTTPRALRQVLSRDDAPRPVVNDFGHRPLWSRSEVERWAGSLNPPS